jgi:8-oxo-dGTP diphosphatase
MEVVVKSLIGIFTIVDGKINLIMDGNNLFTICCDDVIEFKNQDFINNNLNIDGLDLKQCYTFSEKYDNRLIISILYSDIVNFESIKSNNFVLMPIENVNKDIYIDKLIECLKKDLVLNSTIKKLYSGEFVLPEIQKIYEDLLNKKYDRRNFRKRLIKLDVIEDLNKMSENKIGRPAKLYRFKDITEDKILF